MTSEKPEKLEPDWTVLYCKSMEDVREAVESKSFIFTQVRLACEEMLSKNRTTHMCTEIWCIESLSSIWVTVTLESAPDSLEKALTWYLDREEYEECSIVLDLKERVEERLIALQIETAFK